MRARPSSGTDSPAGSTASGHDVLAQHQQPHHHQLTGSKVDYCHMQDKSNDLHHASAVDALGSHPKGIENALVDKDPAAALQLAAANMEPLTQQQQQQQHQQGRLPQLSSSGQHDQHDSASSSAGGDGMLSTSCALLVQQQQAEGDTANSPDTHPAAVAAQVSKQGRPAATALSSGTTGQSVISAGPSRALQCLHQQQPQLQRPAPSDSPPFLQQGSADTVDPAGDGTAEGSSSSTYEPGPPDHHQLDSTALNGDVAAAAAAAVALQATTAGLAAASAKGAAGMLMMHAGGTAAAAAAAPNRLRKPTPTMFPGSSFLPSAAFLCHTHLEIVQLLQCCRHNISRHPHKMTVKAQTHQLAGRNLLADNWSGCCHWGRRDVNLCCCCCCCHA